MLWTALFSLGLGLAGAAEKPSALAATCGKGADCKLVERCREAERYLGAWSGRESCQGPASGTYALGFTLSPSGNVFKTRYSSTLILGKGKAFSGSAEVYPASQPETCMVMADTSLGRLEFVVRFLKQGRLITYQSRNLQTMGVSLPIPVDVRGSAKLDESLRTATFEVVSRSPMGRDVCQGSLAKKK